MQGCHEKGIIKLHVGTAGADDINKV